MFIAKGHFEGRRSFRSRALARSGEAQKTADRRSTAFARGLLVAATILAMFWVGGLHSWHDALREAPAAHAAAGDFAPTDNAPADGLHKAAHAAGHVVSDLADNAPVLRPAIMLSAAWPMPRAQLRPGVHIHDLMRPPRD